jgi:hypothetical protein
MEGIDESRKKEGRHHREREERKRRGTYELRTI